MGTFCCQYIDLTRKFTKILVNHKEKENVTRAIKSLDAYWKLLYLHGLKDNRVLEMERKTSRMSIVLRLLFRAVAASVLAVAAVPGFVLALPLVIVFRLIPRRAVRMGLAYNYDEVAQNKVSALFCCIKVVQCGLCVGDVFRWWRYGQWCHCSL